MSFARIPRRPLLGALVASACLLSLAALPRSRDRAPLPFAIGQRVGMPPFVAKDAGRVVDIRGNWILVDVERSNAGTFAGGGRAWFNLEQLTAVLPEQPPLDDEEKVRVAKDEILAIHAACVNFAIDNGMRYPDSLRDLVTPDEREHRLLDAREVPKDPWGNEYFYRAPEPGREYPLIGSFGADGKPGGEGVDRDLDSATIQGEGN